MTVFPFPAAAHEEADRIDSLFSSSPIRVESPDGLNPRLDRLSSNPIPCPLAAPEEMFVRRRNRYPFTSRIDRNLRRSAAISRWDSNMNIQRSRSPSHSNMNILQPNSPSHSILKNIMLSHFRSHSMNPASSDSESDSSTNPEPSNSSMDFDVDFDAFT